MGVYYFPMSEIGGASGINTDLLIDPNSIPHFAKGEVSVWDLIPKTMAQ